MSDKIELLPCPFCGSTNLVKSPWIECDNCGAMGPSPRDCDNYSCEWNRRASLTQQPAPVVREPVAWPAAAHDLVRDWQTGMASSNEVCIARVVPLYTVPPAAAQPEAWEAAADPRERPSFVRQLRDSLDKEGRDFMRQLRTSLNNGGQNHE